MSDPYWPGYPPERKPPLREKAEPKPLDKTIQPTNGAPGMLLPAIGLPWGILGPIFAMNMSHFGWGFGPGVLWLWSLPILFLVFVVGAIAAISRFASWKHVEDAGLRLFLWVASGIVYLLIPLFLAGR